METITLTIEQVAEHLASFMRLRKQDFITLDDLVAVRCATESLVGKEIYKKALEMAKEITSKED